MKPNISSNEEGKLKEQRLRELDQEFKKAQEQLKNELKAFQRKKTSAN